MTIKYTCPCCGYKTLEEEGDNTYEICDICGWEVDDYQTPESPDAWGGANVPSLRDAQQNFIHHGQANPDIEDEDGILHRKPTDQDERDLDWQPLPPKPTK